MNLDKNLTELAKYYGAWTYLLLFVIVFCETRLVVTPFLPGDSMIFVIGALSANGELNLVAITLVLILAAILGDTANYHIGKLLGLKIFNKENVRFLNKEYLMRIHEFYEFYEKHDILEVYQQQCCWSCDVGSIIYNKRLLLWQHTYC